jgi:hypothetical protein
MLLSGPPGHISRQGGVTPSKERGTHGTGRIASTMDRSASPDRVVNRDRNVTNARPDRLNP